VQEPSDARTQAATDFRVRQLARRPPIVSTGCCPTFFRAAVGPAVRGGTPFDPEIHRQHYTTGDDGEQNVYWDQWDTSFDTSVYATNLYEQTNDATEGPVIAGVALLKRGLYSIYALVDFDDVYNGISVMKTNYDQGQDVFRAVNNIGVPGEPFLTNHYPMQIHEWRWVEDTNPDTTPPISFYLDGWFGGDAMDVEIVVAVNTEAAPWAGVSPGKYTGSPTVPTPGADLWIPGGYNGAWGLVPQLIVAYWGDFGAEEGIDPNWPASFGLSRT
jgi:hypothetical protein